MKLNIWTVEYALEKDSGIWARRRVVAKDYLEAIEKSNKLINDAFDEAYVKKLRIVKIEEEEETLDAT
jgi:hypothetical protein